MLPVSDELRTLLGLNNESVQLQVCSDYNFHSEESFKVNYWKKVVVTLATHSSQGGALGAVSPAAIKQWWNSQVCTRSLQGLGKVFHTILATSGGEITSLSRIRQRHSVLFSDSPVLAKCADGPSFVGRVVGFAGSMVRGIWRAALGNASDDETEAIEGNSVSMDETLLCQELINKFSKRVLETLQVKAGLDGGPLESILVAETDVVAAIQESSGSPVVMPFIDLPSSTVTTIIMTSLVDTCKAVPFRANAQINCLKLPDVDGQSAAGVTDRDKAYIMNKIAGDKLLAHEEILSVQWATADAKVREHLAAGRKPLALACLKERKMVEKRIEEIQIYKLKLAESHSVTQTALIQQAVVEALAVGTKAGKEVVTNIDHIGEVLEEAAQLKQEVQAVSDAIGAGVAQDGAEDEDIFREYEALVTEKQAEEQMHALEILSEIPPPPTQLPGTHLIINGETPLTLQEPPAPVVLESQPHAISQPAPTIAIPE